MTQLRFLCLAQGDQEATAVGLVRVAHHAAFVEMDVEAVSVPAMNLRQVEQIKAQIRRNAEILRQLHAQVHECHAERDLGPAHRARWEAACAAFHARYDLLAFPGGYAEAYARIAAGDRRAIEAALCFVEVRPWFYRSGYIYRDLIRKLRRATLTPDQAARFADFEQRLAAWKASRRRADSAA